MAASTESYMHLDQSAFNYDYETLQTTGVILAMVMFVTGILIALNPVQWKALSHQRQKFRLRQCKEDVCVRWGDPFWRGNVQTHKDTYRNVEEIRTCLTSFCNLSLNAVLLLYF
ncbi:FXYD domain-containing ion transport regulator 7-like isoform X2 [Myxocyprinus asiaticus]|uniref:FXYD domain-containing ion transport regulator 7-like isoform X2 n=1 Tax=Myxocyprinus asiaticus TaxID=70543 RepID=UPI0022229DF5|nr:FXYD domain-containing ion transport regulator 7-like isoform X2 [Myxocyprinus asiaticus]